MLTPQGLGPFLFIPGDQAARLSVPAPGTPHMAKRVEPTCKRVLFVAKEGRGKDHRVQTDSPQKSKSSVYMERPPAGCYCHWRNEDND